MIEKIEDRWQVNCDLCSWNTETEIEREAKQQLSRHIDVTHKQPSTKVREKRSPVPDNVKQANLPEAEKPQGINKK